MLKIFKRLFNKFNIAVGLTSDSTEDMPEYIQREQELERKLFKMIDDGLMEFDPRGAGRLRYTKKGLKTLVKKHSENC